MSLALAAALLAAAPPAEAPSDFLERVYAGTGRRLQPAGSSAPSSPARSSPPSRKMRGFRATKSALDADPLCSARIRTGFGRSSARYAGRLRRGRPTAAVILTFSGSDRRELEIRLVRTGAGWRVADIATADDPSLLESLRRFNARRRGQEKTDATSSADGWSPSRGS